MKRMITIRSTAVPLNVENIDTDQIIPARFLKSVVKTGFGKNLFYDWRHDHEGNPKKDFILNDVRFKGKILVAGRNFGCGSSREHAAWALEDYGFQAVISSFFADIFKNNALNNLLLPIVVDEKTLKRLFKIVKKNPKTEFMIDIKNQSLECISYQLSQHFDLDPYKKLCFMKGYDDIDYLLSKKTNIEAFEQNRKYDFHIR